ncbi:hypothetical protein DFA_06847 [Cavenderia fasciculata]|uniref:Uncharacterized protein n=1 Tax=Cavenderia fasciculata TaxID=261658 RepID=F4Q2G0_CACFS|nr:uncharacterized protein DFA_06847 [Cavenderia fasciculata]EGG18180.1 hypothetical protein DFA_06847 [Cavenderia fasciculata]|eukprot:XP_004366221.1 hypothetical protein DFA_06847 [Cavenderia fasciculata]
MAGNPSFNYTTDAQYYLPFMAGHGLLSFCDFQNLTDICQGSFYPGTAECHDAFNTLSTNFDLIYPYNILQACKGGGPSKVGGCFTTSAFLSEQSLTQKQSPSKNIYGTTTQTKGMNNNWNYYCIGFFVGIQKVVFPSHHNHKLYDETIMMII